MPGNLNGLRNTDDSVYQVGQEWSYKTRSGEEASTFTVVRVESHPKYGNIIHISLEGLNIKNTRQQSGFSDVVPHLAFSEEAIDKSVVKILKKQSSIPEDLKEDVEESYNFWRQSFEEGQASIITMTIAEGLDYIEKTINKSDE